MILRYHRVAQTDFDPHATCVSPANFSEHLEVLKRHYQPIGLGDLVAGLNNRTLPRLGVVITLDDGYQDNLLEAKPRLVTSAVPATVFVTSAYVGGGREFWWDELARLLLHPGTLPGVLRLTIGGRVHSWELGDAAQYSADSFHRLHAWNWRCGHYPTARHRVFREVFELLQPLAEHHSQDLVRELLSCSDKELAARSTHRVLSSEELAQLADNELIEIGAHSVNHPLFSGLSRAQKREEIQASKTRLQALLGKPVRSFAYPYGVVGGSASDVAAAGYHAACTTSPKAVFHGQNPYELPRVYVGDWNGDEFERRLRVFA